MRSDSGINVVIQRRAEIALRSLDWLERRKVEAAISVLGITSLNQLMKSGKIKALRIDAPRQLYSMRVRKLRLILSSKQSQWIVEDIVDHEHLPRNAFAREAS